MKPDDFENDHEPNYQEQKLQQEPPEATPTEKRFLKALHWMRCPKCGHALRTERHGSLDIGFCASCRGVWLDATALETLVAPENDFVRSCLRNLHRH